MKLVLLPHGREHCLEVVVSIGVGINSWGYLPSPGGLGFFTAATLMTGELLRISTWYNIQPMQLYKRCICIPLVVWKRFQAASIGAFAIQQHKEDEGSFFSRRFFSESISSPFFLLPVRLQYHGRKGFTLLEVMMVIAIIGTLAAIAIPNYIDYRQKAQNIKTLQIIRTIEKELAIFNIEHGFFPETLAEAGLGHLKDSWGNPFQYLNLQTLDEKGKGKGKGKVRKDHSLHPLNSDYDLYSMGPDGKSVPPLTGKPSKDDIIRANDGAFLGKASDY